MTFGGHIVYLWPEQHHLRLSGASEGANYATRDTNKLHTRQKSFDYHYYQYTRSNCCLSPRKKLIFHFERKSPTLQKRTTNFNVKQDRQYEVGNTDGTILFIFPDWYLER